MVHPEKRDGNMTAAARKSKYHHGDLREALISAAFDGISAAGADGFTMADACRIAGVSVLLAALAMGRRNVSGRRDERLSRK